MVEKLWDGRFSEKTDKSVEAFTSSIDIDKRLYAYDIEGSIAHCKMLAKTQIIADDEASRLIEGLKQVKNEIENSSFKTDDSLEDIHMHIESRLTQIVGEVAQKLHTARSRNDQVAVDIRLYLKDEVKNIIGKLVDLKKIIIKLSKKHIDVFMPGYTHMQRAQPVLLSHHLMAYYEMFSRDRQRFDDCIKRIDVMPLGSAALAGTTYPIDRQYTANLLGFSKISANSIDAVSDRDFIIEFLASASICMMHLSRMSEELIIWTSSEFNFIELSDAFSTGSSIMPQKKNPDVPELVRGKSGRVFGNLIALLSIMKSLPLAYNRDMQEDKEPLFDSVDTLKACINIFALMLDKIKINQSNTYKATLSGFLNATDMADYLATRGMPFRKAHACVGNCVNYAQNNNKELHELSIDELKLFSPLIDKEIYEFLTTEKMVNRRISFGGTARDNVLKAINKAEKKA